MKAFTTFMFAAKKLGTQLMASNLLFILENKSWRIKSHPKQIPKSCPPQAIPILALGIPQACCGACGLNGPVRPDGPMGIQDQTRTCQHPASMQS